MIQRHRESESDFFVRFWGARGTYASPGSHIFGGHTCCVEVYVGGRRLVLDAGSGIIPLGRQWPEDESMVTLLLTHLHRDHIEGLGFFAPLRRASTDFFIYGPCPPDRSLEDVLREQLSPPVFPLPWESIVARRTLTTIKGGDTLVWTGDVPAPLRIPAGGEIPPAAGGNPVVHVMQSYAHPQNVFVFRIEWRDRAVVYATDVEGYVGGDRRLIDFARDADVLIHDAAYTQDEYAHPNVSRQGWGHSTPEMAIAVARAADVPRLIFFHHDPTHDDTILAEMEAAAQAQFAGAQMAREGLTIDVDTIEKYDSAGVAPASPVQA